MLNKKISKLKLFLIVFLIGNITFYFNERSKWIYDEQPYPDAKEWLIPANMMLVYGKLITKLPLVDERSLIVKPIISLQDYFVSKWQENLPDDDAEKYLGWYIFKLRTYIINTSGGIILYGNKEYSLDESRDINDKAWETIEALIKYDAKNKEFNEIRYAAFNNLGATFVSNFTVYWIKNPSEKSNYATSKSYVDVDAMQKDDEKHQRLIKLYKWIYQMDKQYQQKYSNIYKKASENEGAGYWVNSRLHKLTKYILLYLSDTGKYKEVIDFCSKDSNVYLKDYLSSKKWLLENEDLLKTKNLSIKKILSSAADDAVHSKCPQINLRNQ